MPHRPRRIDLTGQRFGRLLVVRFDRVARSPSDGRTHGAAMWWCRCDCGTEKSIRGISLRRGLTVSCGCKHREYARLYGFKGYGKDPRCPNPGTVGVEARKRFTPEDRSQWAKLAAASRFRNHPPKEKLPGPGRGRRMSYEEAASMGRRGAERRWADHERRVVEVAEAVEHTRAKRAAESKPPKPKPAPAPVLHMSPPQERVDFFHCANCKGPLTPGWEMRGGNKPRPYCPSCLPFAARSVAPKTSFAAW